MKNRVAPGLLVAAALAALPAAAAELPKGFYLGGAVGPVFPMDSDISGSGISAEADLDPGVSVLGALGYAYGNGWRAEFAIGGRWVDADRPSGDVSVLDLMVNGYYDFKTETSFTPYVGAGIGGARVDFDGLAPVGASSLDDAGWTFAYQAIAGVAYALNDQWSAFADYRYFRTVDTDLSTAAGTGVEAEYADHRIMLGLRFDFGAKPAAPVQPAQAPARPVPPVLPMPTPTPPAMPLAQPAPPPAAATAPAVPPRPAAPETPRNFLVFFDWDKSDLKPDALAVIRAAADNAKRGGVSRIEATGHADRSGPDPYNLRLSERRAQAVKAELIRLGVAERDIAVAWKGEREPLVPTPDGVREPQNRRVEIVFK